MYFLIGGWGYANRVYAALKFFLFTMFGSALMLVGIVSLAFLHRNAMDDRNEDLAQEKIAEVQANPDSLTPELQREIESLQDSHAPLDFDLTTIAESRTVVDDSTT